MYSSFAAQGFDLAAEESTSAGRSDMVVRFGEGVYVFEFKLTNGEPPGRALAQVKEKGYADKHRRPGCSIHLIGVEFSREARNVATFEVERAA